MYWSGLFLLNCNHYINDIYEITNNSMMNHLICSYIVEMQCLSKSYLLDFRANKDILDSMNSFASNTKQMSTIFLIRKYKRRPFCKFLFFSRLRLLYFTHSALLNTYSCMRFYFFFTSFNIDRESIVIAVLYLPRLFVFVFVYKRRMLYI